MNAGESTARFGMWGALVTALGALASGPLALAIVELTHPQPAWQGGEAFVQSYHAIQTLPFFCGFVLIGGFVMLISALHLLAPDELRARTTASLVFAAGFAAIAGINYTVQTTFVSGIVARYVPSDAVLVRAFSMSSPSSLAWALEMWAYAFLGIATWLCAPVLSSTRLERRTGWLLAANGPLSIASAIATAVSPGWVLSPIGLASFLVWNALVIAVAAMAFVALRKRARALSSLPVGAQPWQLERVVQVPGENNA